METTHPAGPRLIPVSTVGTQRRSSEPRAATVRWAGTITVTTEAPVVKPNDRGFQKTLQGVLVPRREGGVTRPPSRDYLEGDLWITAPSAHPDSFVLIPVSPSVLAYSRSSGRIGLPIFILSSNIDIVTADNDLLSVGAIENIPIVDVPMFWRTLTEPD
jgi:hypothetical protein